MATLGEYLGAGASTTKLLLHLNGSSVDSSGNGNNGTDTNITYSQANGKFGQGAGFNGTSSSITTSLSDNINTISIWFYGEIATGSIGPNTDEWGGVIGQRSSDTNGFVIRRFASQNNLGYKIAGTDRAWGNNSSNGLFDNKWHHLVLIKNGSNTEQYTDGVLVYTLSGVTWTTTGNVHLGTSYIGGGIFAARHKGKIDEVIIENRAWTASEVKKYYTYAKGMFGII